MVKRAFRIIEPNYRNLVDWFKTAAIYSQEERKCKTYVVLDEEEKVLGYIALSMVLPADPIPGLSNRTQFNPQMVLIGKLYVLPEYRSAGIGTKLLEFALDVAINVDEMIGCIGILVDSNNDERTVNFYKRFGFEEISRATRTVKMFFKIPPQPIVSSQPELEL